MRIITGDECGILKESIPEVSRVSADGKDAKLSASTDGVSRIELGAEMKMSRSRGIVDLAFSQKQSSALKEDAGSLSFCALRSDGSLDHFEGYAPYNSKEDRICGGTYRLSNTIKNVFEDKESPSEPKRIIGRPIGMCSAYQYQNLSNETPHNILACCTSMGYISVVNANSNEKGVVAQYNAYSNGNNSSIITYTGGNIVNRDIATAMAMSDDASKIVVGGRERTATMLDTETGLRTWKAKNLPANPQTLLQQPIWSTSIQFLSRTDTTPVKESTDLLAIGTAYKQLQIYDVRTDAIQKRPVLYTPEWDSTKENVLEHRVTSLCQLDSNRIIVGDSAGFMNTIDLRKITNKHGRSLSSSVGRYCGPAGSIRQIVKHETLPIVACVGLDRMLRTYDVNKRKQLDCVYLKQRLNCMLFCSDGSWSGKDFDEDEDDLEEEGEGKIDDEDEIADYIDSSADEDGSAEDEEASEDEVTESEEEPNQKRRRR
uniref:Ribosome biogenesis protein NSA1 n=1 Tax=Chaetoceros debilis TaxID=122233 RepID=A0A7S3V454_9STRA|mmetsp:Transcript_3758/g.5614  ORF Transcript_3758/g.5614 Transcript_3758/m.5614 type:complete len:486 (-) Transcript_3758:75-1532(-)|eukprot:CAMPEP_0194072434 /NCGR_PEP_ID=MMETSP0149-20130528/186_1 /TAXON_ID=122233 /ORGANISM="Chaetoceros debilis, Strain MM31A-1" /LENGTH=485 /DNA_ID=CAMNT_0038752321 /DNA_START=104 /DNA_END=1561 /DNA_ORIENTATION=-